MLFILSECCISTFLPPFPDAAFLLRASQRCRLQSLGTRGVPRLNIRFQTVWPCSALAAHRYYDGSDSCLPSPRLTGLPACLATSSQHCVSNHVMDPGIALHAKPQRTGRVSGFAMREVARRYIPPKRVRHPAHCQFALRLLSTPLRSDAVTFGYRVLACPDTDSHRADVAPSRAHSPGPLGLLLDFAAPPIAANSVIAVGGPLSIAHHACLKDQAGGALGAAASRRRPKAGGQPRSQVPHQPDPRHSLNRPESVTSYPTAISRPVVCGSHGSFALIRTARLTSNPKSKARLSRTFATTRYCLNSYLRIFHEG
jgi:hypothetical protein